MYVQQIELVNFKTLKEFKQDFSGGIYLIKGENEVGKTTLIDAIVTLLTGDRSDNLLTIGAEKGFAKMTVGDEKQSYEIELRYTQANPRGVLTISQTGSQLKSDRLTVLQDILKYQDFDANEFVRWSETAEGRRKQVKLVKSLLPDEVQKKIEEIEMTISTHKNEITVINSDIRVFENFVKQSKVIQQELETYSIPIDTRELIDEKTRAAQTNEQIRNVKETLNAIGNPDAIFETKCQELNNKFELEIKDIDSESERLKREFDAAMERLHQRASTIKVNRDNSLEFLHSEKEKSNKEIEVTQNWLSNHAEISLDQIQKKIDEAAKHNEMVTKVSEHKKNVAALEVKVNEKRDKETIVFALGVQKEKLIQESKLPIDGLSFDEEGLILNHIPFKVGEISTSQEMEVAARLIIAKNPNVKVFKIAQGESLGAKRLKAIVDFAKENGYQGFIENVVRGLDELKVEEYTEL
jgi:hypothetical protein